MKRQNNLFGDEPAVQPSHLARREHPETSKESAKKLVQSGKLGEAMEIALTALRKHPGSTAAELEDVSLEHPGAVRKRLTDLKKAGLAEIHSNIIGRPITRKCRVTGRKAQVWFPTGVCKICLWNGKPYSDARSCTSSHK